MTEEEAKTKWCPISGIDVSILLLGASTIAQRFNNKDMQELLQKTNEGLDGKNKCVGSACCWGCDPDGKWLGQCGLVKGFSLAGKP